MGKRIIITGGSGKVGRHVIEFLLNQGHEILNLDLMPLPETLNSAVHTLKVDLTDSGQVYSAMSSHFKLTEPFPQAEHRPDAVIHLAGYARNMLVPDNETFRANTTSSYNVIEAACRLGLRKIVLASSVCVYGVTYADGDVDFSSFPIDEEIDVDPMDVYSLSKVCAERTGRSFARRFGVDVYALRIGAVVTPDEYGERFASYVGKPDRWKVHGWSYTDARDLGKMCHLCVMKDGLGFQVFNATNDTITNQYPTVEFLSRVCPDTPFTREMGYDEAPMTNKKLKTLLGFTEDHPWQRYYTMW
ncbi:hypothetical protein ATEG_08703 [Paecilomyces variotii No. 5]|uniref:NAD-dependent epimerase/dehydratase domain-containing protein n=1 Tax=Byssochlamys spectabilis (strain No. 5 / NBRC 109023) TaxID=1356009 RepID=V5G8L4_BYSSN|nr:hypothetical protein ATEG_08703 [Paecilomyces variotii No. 5]